MPVLCRYCAALAETEIVAAVILVFHALPSEFLQGEAEVGEVGYVGGFQMLGELLLYGGCSLEVLTIVLGDGLKDLREYHFWC